MPGETLIDLEFEILRSWRKYYRNPQTYARRIKMVAKKYDAQARVLLFGSIVKGHMRPGSDIDVLVITRLAENVDARLKLRVEIAKEIGEVTPFEVHIVTPEEYENWYRKFLDKYEEV